MNSTILVFTGEDAWTRRAVHLAAAMARDVAAEVRILRLLPVARLEDLGAGLREEMLTYGEYETLAGWVDTVKAYGVPAGVDLFEFTDYTGAVLSAAEQLSPVAIFAPAPWGRPAFVGTLRLWWLRRRLARPLYTLGVDDSPPAWTETAPAPEQSPAAAAAPAANAR